MEMAKDSKIGERAGIAFVGFTLLGIAIGMLIDQTAVGVLAGLGLGFLAMALFADR